MKMKIAITGATGFLGSHAAKTFLSRGDEVTGLGRDLKSGSALSQAGIRFVPGSLADPGYLEQAFQGKDAVVHCAALSSPWGRPDDFFRANVEGTRNVLRAALVSGVDRVIHISSPSIYVDFRDRLLIRESEPLPSVNLNEYIRTKKLAEEKVDDAAARGLPVITLRPQGIFGPGDTAIFPRIIRVAERGIFPMIGDGGNWIDMTFVGNVVDAISLAISAPSFCVGRKYNITNGEPVKNYAVIESTLKALGIPFRFKRIPFRLAYCAAGALEFASRNFLNYWEPPLTRYSVCVLAKTRTLCLDAARADLGYAPKIGMQEGLDRFVHWWKNERPNERPNDRKDQLH